MTYQLNSDRKLWLLQDSKDGMRMEDSMPTSDEPSNDIAPGASQTGSPGTTFSVGNPTVWWRC